MLQRIMQAQKQMDATCAKLGRQINIMEVCGTHTVSIFRSGLRASLPKQLKLLSGPGCPVCVTDQSYIDIALELADRKDCIIVTYGDMIRVPGAGGSLETKTTNNNIKLIFSAEDALGLAKDNPDKTVVLIAVGFETTAPATAVVLTEAVQQKIDNFCILSGHKLVIPAMHALLGEINNKIDAFLCPGHVSVIIGYRAFDEIVKKYSKPCVVAGFEPMQIIEGIAEICKQLENNTPQSKSIYGAVVTRDGNKNAQQLLDKVFETADGYWRGLGLIPKSTLKLRAEYKKFDAIERFGIEEKPADDKSGCRCGEVLCGLIDPPTCELFGNHCTPQKPIGPCMVSSEGACSAWYKYGGDKGNS